jgi:Rrf2 family transcriptional regulator, iron-sulfur cluster assembly transcription factor
MPPTTLHERTRMIGRSAQYALRALLFMARCRDEGPLPAHRIAAATGVPETFMPKLLLRMSRAGLVASTRGRAGGFSIDVDPATLTISSIIQAFDEPLATSRCLLGDYPCIIDRPCPAHGVWTAAADAALEPFRRTTLADLLGPPRLAVLDA